MRDRIKSVATDMFMQHGYNGVSFLDIGKVLGITHSNIHYHFKNKASLALEVIQDYANATLETYGRIWRSTDASLREKMIASRDWGYTRYCIYNPGGRGGASWGLLARFSMDADSLDIEIKRELLKVFRQIDADVEKGVAIAVERGDLSSETPQRDVMLQITCVLYSSRQMTRYDGKFDRLDTLFRATIDSVERAYGASSLSGPWPAPGSDASTSKS